MARIIEEEVAGRIAAWISANRPQAIPASVPVWVANRDEIKSRPCIVVEASEAKIVQPMRHTSRMKLGVHVFTQIDATQTSAHNAWAHAIGNLLSSPSDLRQTTSDETFLLHDLTLQETAAGPDESRGRQTTLTYEAVASAV